MRNLTAMSLFLLVACDELDTGEVDSQAGAAVMETTWIPAGESAVVYVDDGLYQVRVELSGAQMDRTADYTVSADGCLAGAGATECAVWGPALVLVVSHR